MPFDLQHVRQDTPGCTHVLHFNAGSSLMPVPVLNATVSHLQLEARIGGYEAAAQAKNSIEYVYDAVGTLIHCSRDEVAIVENATRAWDMAFYSIAFQAGDRILTASNEYASNYIAFLQRAHKTGASIEVIPNDGYGQVSLDGLKNMLDSIYGGRVVRDFSMYVVTYLNSLNPHFWTYTRQNGFQQIAMRYDQMHVASRIGRPTMQERLGWG